MRRQIEQEQEKGRSFFAVSLFADFALGALKLPDSEYRFFRALLDHVDFQTGKCSPSKALLLAATNTHRKTGTRALANLKSRGLIDFKRASKRLGFRYQYSFPWWDSEELQQFIQRLHRGQVSIRELVTVGEAPALGLSKGLKAKGVNLDPALGLSEGHCFGAIEAAQELLEPKEKTGSLVRQGLDYSEVSPLPRTLAPTHPPHPQEQNLTEENKLDQVEAVLNVAAAVLATKPEPRTVRKVPVLSTTDAGEKVFETLQKKALEGKEK